MPAGRGSRHKLQLIKEVTFGTTPATPAMIEIPVTSYTPNIDVGVIRSNQIRSHPFVDRLLHGVDTFDHEMGVELQDDNFDVLFELLCGDTWATNALKAKDVLSSCTLESAHADLTLFDQYVGTFIRRCEISCQAAEDAAVTATFGLMSKSGTLDAATTLANSQVAATDVDPFVFADATVTINAVSRPVTAVSMVMERSVDPLRVLGTRAPREYIPSDFTLTGQITIPLEDNVESGRLVGFSNAPLVVKVGDAGQTNWRQFSIPKVKYKKMGRPINNRGVILQTIDWEAHRDSVTDTVVNITRSA